MNVVAYQSVFRVLIESTMRAASTDKSRPHLNAIEFDAFDDKLGAFATNGHWMARCEAFGAMLVEPGSALVPLEMVKRMLPLVKRDGVVPGLCELRVDSNTIHFSVVGTVLTSRKIEAQPIDWKRVVPTARKPLTFVGVSPAYIADIAASVSAVSVKRNPAIRMEGSGGLLDPVVIDAPTAEPGFNWLGVLMPMRIEASAEFLSAQKEAAE